MTGIFVPTRRVTHAFLGAGAALGLGAAIAMAVAAKTWALVLSALAVTPVLIGLFLLPLTNRHERAARDLVSGDCLLRWTYSAAEWAAYVAREQARPNRLPIIFALFFTLAGVAVSVMAVADDERIADSLPLTWLAPSGSGLIVGAATALVFAWFHRSRLHRMAAMPGVFAFGPQGLYLTGGYWPIRDLGVGLRGVTIEGDELVFAFSIQRNHQSVRVPIPAAEREAARAVVAQLSDDRVPR